MTHAITFRDVVHRYPGAERAVLDGVQLEIATGEFCVILGRSGMGKSTLLRAVNGFVQPQSGTVAVLDNAVGTDARSLRRARKNVGFIFQSYNLVNRLTVLQNVLTGMFSEMPGHRAVLGAFTRAEREQAFDLLETVGLAEHANKRADRLSGGQKQRVGIARALAQRPAVLLADEPVASLDPVTSEEILELLQKINQRDGITVLVSLHQIDYARNFGERIIALQGGKLAIDTPAADLNDAQIDQIYQNTPVSNLTPSGALAGRAA